MNPSTIAQPAAVLKEFLRLLAVAFTAGRRIILSMPDRKQTEEHCIICGCKVHRDGDYAKPTIKGRSHATKHHFVAERFFGRSTNRRGEQRDRLFESCPWGVEGKAAVFCYDCHELLLHNPVFLPADIEAFARLVQDRGLCEDEKTDSTEKLAGRIRLMREVISKGIASLREPERRHLGALEDQTARAIECRFGGQSITVENALAIRDAMPTRKRSGLDFECLECGKAVRPHNAGGTASAHFEHLIRNPQCKLSDPSR
ncbi:MAG: hypothetical protein ACOYOU_05595 [Kiritimatiellia bacterium]